ncbi:DUF6520 family protein [Mucilaginibacter ginsenosidivorans]|uniref:Uncharacterized protein n=1 Tax=Mucilaginibacter ginsenosidivorans TaxID=398053 RepID=A0A5B8UUG2_9SPHI|nr:DUF6520 family protein [Mucilaginibacter ginsenosidivorans]QEC62528.1 hypothetical protein FRZ54_07975 [Mucilaginibacter ginsenosidivorans]
MKKLKVSITALALVLGVGTAFATTAYRPFTNKTWALNPSTGLYMDITGQVRGVDYNCTGASGTCTADFPSDVNPNDQAHDAHPGTVQGTNIQTGVFSN